MSRVQLEGVSKAYGREPAVQDLTLEVREGEFLTLLGPSGCGKTTTLRIVAGFLAPDAGRVRIGEQDVTALPPRLRDIGMVFQDYALFPHLSVAENVAFALRERGVERGQVARRVDELLALVRLPGAGHRYPGELSGGQQQRVGLARALAHTPRVLLMDEPLGALDLKLRESMQAELHAIQRSLKITTIYVTHDQEEALSLSHRIALMRRGRVLQLDEPRRLYTAPTSPFAAYFLGRINFMRGEVTGKSGGTYHVALANGTVARVPLDSAARELRETLDAAAARGAGAVTSVARGARGGPGATAGGGRGTTGRSSGPGGGADPSSASPVSAPVVARQVVLAVRPEHLRATTALPPPGQNALTGRVVREKFVGSAVHLTVSVAGGPAVVVEGPAVDAFAAPGTGVPRAGTDVTISWDPAATLMYRWEPDPELGL